MALAQYRNTEGLEMKQANFRLPRYLVDELQSIAELEYRSLNAQAAIALREFIEEWNARQFLTRQ